MSREVVLLFLTLVPQYALGERAIIVNVPDYQNEWFPGGGDCAPTAAACILGYWDDHGYDLLISGQSDYLSNPGGVKELVDFLKQDMGWISTGTPIGENIPKGIERVANVRRCYAFDASMQVPASWDQIKTELRARRPLLFGSKHEYYGEHHTVAVVGFIEGEGPGAGTYYPSCAADSYVDSSRPNRNFGSEVSLSVGAFPRGERARTYLRFDLTMIPADVRVQAARLELRCGILEGGEDVLLVAAGGQWREEDITWGNQPGFSVDSKIARFAPPREALWWVIDVSDIVKDWMSGAVSNYGFLVSGQGEKPGNFAVVYSRECEVVPWRPKLVVSMGWSDKIIVVHDNWSAPYRPFDPDVWLNFEECSETYSTFVSPSGDAPTWYPDRDTDGYPYQGDPVKDCVKPSDYILARGDGRWDCNDGDGTVYPGAPEPVCGGPDKNCDGVAPAPCTDSILKVIRVSGDFGDVDVGKCKSNDPAFSVENAGGGTLIGTVSTSAPFSICRGGSFNLGAGQSQNVCVQFCPTAEGAVQRDVSFSSNGGSSTSSVTGRGILSRSEVGFVRGDANQDGAVDIADPICVLSYLFGADQDRCKDLVGQCLDAADANDDGSVDVADPIYLIYFIFAAGRAIPAPAGSCGKDPTPDALACEKSRCPQAISWRGNSLPVPSLTETRAVILTDFNGDNMIDLFVGNVAPDARNLLYLNKGTAPYFDTWTVVGDDALDTIGVAVGSINSDPYPDIITSTYLASAHQFYLNAGSRSDPFGGVPGTRFAPESGSSHSVALGDVNGDGLTDVVISSYNNGGHGNRLYLSTGEGLFQDGPYEIWSYRSPSDGLYSTGTVIVRDLNGDNRPDLITANYPIYPSYYFINDGTSPNPFGTPLELAPSGIGLLSLGDFDNDRDIDIIAAEADAAGIAFAVVLYRNSGSVNRPFSYSERELVVNVPPTPALPLASGDLEPDGDIDLFIGIMGGKTLLLLNNGTGNPWQGVGPQPLTDDVNETYCIAAGDVDGDEDLDVVIGTNRQGLRIYINESAP